MIKYSGLTIFILCLLGGALLTSPAQAQRPQYVRDCSGGFSGAFQSWGWASPAPFGDSTPRKNQCIYPTKQFTPKPPKGYITAFYYRNCSASLAALPTRTPGSPPRLSYAYNFKIYLGWTNRDTFGHMGISNPQIQDTFLPKGTLIFSSAVVQQNLDDSGGLWMRFPVQDLFLFDPAQGQNLLVTQTFGPPWVKGVFGFMDSCSGGPYTRLYGYDTSEIVRYKVKTEGFVWGSGDFGFDINPLGISPGSFGGNFSVFPNPAKEGITIDLEGQKTINDLSISVRSLSGQTVFYTQFLPKSSHFSKYLSLPNVAKGMYFVEIEADGERAVQRVLLQ